MFAKKWFRRKSQQVLSPLETRTTCSLFINSSSWLSWLAPTQLRPAHSPFYFSFEKTLQIHHIQSTRWEFPIRLRYNRIISVFDSVRYGCAVVDGIEIPLVHVSAGPNWESWNYKTQFHVFVVDLKCFVSYIAVVVYVFIEIFWCREKAVNVGLKIKTIVEREFLLMSFFFYQSHFFYIPFFVFFLDNWHNRLTIFWSAWDQDHIDMKFFEEPLDLIFSLNCWVIWADKRMFVCT